MGDVSGHPKENHTSYRLSHLYVYLSDGCSLSCHDCWMPFHKSAAARFLPEELVVQALSEAVPLGLETIHLCGNDLLAHPQLDRLLDRFESLELGVEIDIHGPGLSTERVQRLARLPRCTVSVALDGADAATHDAIHSAPGAFEQIVRSVREMVQAGMPVELVYHVVRANAGQLDRAVRLAEELGVSALRFTVQRPVTNDDPPRDHYPQQGSLLPGTVVLPAPVRNGANGNNGKNGHHPAPRQEDPDSQLYVEELIALGRRVERDLTRTTRVTLIFEQPPAFRGLHPRARIEGAIRCDVLRSLSLLPTGEYALCGLGRNVPELMFGRAGETPLERIWNTSLALLRLRGGMPDRLEGVCAHCTLRASCLGFCAAENYTRTGSFWSPYWFCDAAERVGLFPAGRLEENVW